jgi:putative ABC transport system permease protein
VSWIHGAHPRLHLLFARRAAESRASEEIGFHIDMETDRLVREGGLAPDEARRRALITFGGVTRHRESLRDGRGLAWLGGLSLDVKLALRMLVKHPGLTLVAVIGMAVAVTIGAVSFGAVYTIIDGRLPVSEGDRVVGIRNIDIRAGDEGRRTHLHDLAVWRLALPAVSELGAYRTVDRNLITVGGVGPSESVRIAEMTASGFRIARVAPLMGRYFHDEDERAGAPAVVVIGYDVWQNRFWARGDIVGQTIQLGDARHVVIGVMPKGFAFPVNNRVWTPLRLNPSAYERGRAPNIDVFGRLAPGATLADARRQIATVGQRLTSTSPETHAFMRPRLIPYTHTFIDNAEATWIYHLIQLLVSMLLVVIGTNVAILVYARTASRMGEIAIRSALGASRRRVVAQLFAEALALSVIATIIGLVFAHVAFQNINDAVARIGGAQLPYWLHFRVTFGVVLYAFALAIVAAVIVGVVPALKATRRQLRANLQQLGSGSSGMRLGRMWTFMIIAQVSVAVAVLPVAIAGISAWRRLETAQTVAAKKQILTATLFLDDDQLKDERAEKEFAGRYLNLRTELVRRLEAEPGVTDVSFASNAPSDEYNTRVEVDEGGNAVVGATSVDLRYFDTFAIPLLAGRGFVSGDIAAPTTAVIVNRSFARKLFGGGSPLGRRIRVASMNPRVSPDTARPAPWEEVVGLVPDFPVDSGTPSPKLYRPMLTTGVEPMTMAVRVKGLGAAQFSNRLRELTVGTSPMLRLESINSLEQQLADASSPTRAIILALGLVTMSTVLLSAAGIYALMAFTITRRRREIGIRSALGAGPRRVLTGVLARAMGQVAIGIVIGTAIAAVLDNAIEGGWTGRRGALGLAAVAALMAAVGLIAAIGPAARALRIQPTEALKSE